jgi:hypothetical protein
MFRPLMGRLAAIALFVGLGLAILAPAASAQVYPNPSTPTTPSCSTYPQPSGCSTNVGGTSTTQSSSLPFTGGNIALLTAIGAIVVTGGVSLIVYSRRRSATT